MNSAPTLPPDLTIAWTPDGLFARRTADETSPVPTVFWFVAAFWSWLAAIPVGMAVGSSTVTLLIAVFGAFAAWRTHETASRAFDIRGDTLVLRGFDRVRLPLHRIALIALHDTRLVLTLDDGETHTLCVDHWSRSARAWGLHVIEEAVARGRRLRALDAPLEAEARRSLAQLRARHREAERRRE